MIKMRKFCAIAVVSLVAFVMVGCANMVTTVSLLDDGRVRQIIQVNFEQNVTAEQMAAIEIHLASEVFGLNWPRGERQIINKKGESVPFEYGMDRDTNIWLDSQTMRLTLTFDNFYSFAYFNEINLENFRERDIITRRSLFFIEQTIISDNPFRHFFANRPVPESGPVTPNRTMQIITALTEDFGGSEEELALVYLMPMAMRHTSTTADRVQRTPDGWNHYFVSNGTSDIPDAEIMYRFANVPIWYAIGTAATIIFMLGLFLTFRGSKKF